MKPTIIIPAYNPDIKLINLVCHLKSLGLTNIIVVDDGSKTDTQTIFETLQQEYECIVIKHKNNLGKGAALKTGMHKTLELFPKGIGCVTADADGQHAPRDILRVAQALEQNPFDLILGTRNFSDKKVPFKSKWGNKITSIVFKITTGITCNDTQTGLRGIPKYAISSLIMTSGERFEYEMNMLLELANKDIEFTEVPIETLYFDDNKGTHFNPVLDSLKIYVNIIKYSIASFASAIIDLSLFSVLIAAGGIGAFVATVFARLLSGIFNFTMNRQFVFKSEGNLTVDGIKYMLLFISQMFVSATCVDLLITADINPLLSKIFIDTLLFIVSFYVQKTVVFKRKRSTSEEKSI